MVGGHCIWSFENANENKCFKMLIDFTGKMPLVYPVKYYTTNDNSSHKVVVYIGSVTDNMSVNEKSTNL